MAGLTQQELNFLQSVLNAMEGYSPNRGDQGPSLAASIASKAATGQLGGSTTVIQRPLLYNSQFLGPTNITQATIIDAGGF